MQRREASVSKRASATRSGSVRERLRGPVRERERERDREREALSEREGEKEREREREIERERERESPAYLPGYPQWATVSSQVGFEGVCDQEQGW